VQVHSSVKKELLQRCRCRGSEVVEVQSFRGAERCRGAGVCEVLHL
jgi:hypothetical protein